MTDKSISRAAILLSMITLIAVILWVKIVTWKMDTIAAMQFGWSDNYTIAKKLFTSDAFKAQQKKQLETAVQQLGTTAPTENNDQAPAQPTPPAQQDDNAQFPGGTLTPDQLAAVKVDQAIEGDKNAKLTIIEYSDLECPFCIRHHNDNTIANAMAAYPWVVNHIFKVVQWVNHPGTEYKSLAALCAKKLKGDEAFVSMYKKILENSSTSAVVPNAKVMEFAQELKINTSDLEACITKWDTKSEYAANWAEFRTFTSSPGTPGNIIINNENGKWKLIAGAYPVDTFKQVIDSLLK
jgi:protein-disulfide isomerase